MTNKHHQLIEVIKVCFGGEVKIIKNHHAMFISKSSLLTCI